MSTETLRPNAAGDECAIADCQSCSECPNHYDCVDEEIADDFTTFVQSHPLVDYDRDLYNIEDHSVGSGTINHIKVYARCYAQWVNQASIKIAIKAGEGTGDPDTVSESAEKALPQDAWSDEFNQWDTNPKTGEKFTWDEIDKLQIGVAIRSAHTGDQWCLCTQVYVEVDYTPVTPKTSSEAGSGSEASTQAATLAESETGSGAEGTPLQSATLAGNETGSGIETLVARLLAAFDTGTGAGAEVGGLLKDLFANELSQGSDSLVAKIETPTKGGGMKLWT